MKHLLAILLLTCISAHGAIIIGTNPDLIVMGTILDGTASDNQSTFSKEIITLGNERKLSDPVLISSLPLEERNGVQHFRILYDQQETGRSGAHRVQIDELAFFASPDDSLTLTTITAAQELWSAPDTIVVNPVDDVSDSPQGNGADLAVLLPVSKLSGFSSDDYFYLLTAQSDSDNGKDEWVLGSGPTFPSGTPIPEPSTVGLLALGLALILRRQR